MQARASSLVRQCCERLRTNGTLAATFLRGSRHRRYSTALIWPARTLFHRDRFDDQTTRSGAVDCPLRARQRSRHKFPDGWLVQIGRQFELDAPNHVATALEQLFWIWHAHALQKEQSDVPRVKHDREDGV